MSDPTKYSDGQLELAKQPVNISGTIHHTKMADHLLERVLHKNHGNVSLVFLKLCIISENCFQVLMAVSKVQVWTYESTTILNL